MQLRFVHRISLLVAVAAFGLVAATAVTLLLGQRSERELTSIETRYVPLVELDRDLKTLFAKITKSLEDAASAAEESRLADADRHVAELAQRIRAGALTIAHNGGDAAALEQELTSYYQPAREVAASLAGGASPANLVAKIETMRAKQIAFESDLGSATRPDRRRLGEAFAEARATQREALVIDIVVAVVVLALMGALSWRIIRRMNRSLLAVSEGVERLAAGDFAHEIVVTSEDEIGDVAREANRTAGRLRDYREQLEASNRDLARASHYKTQFLANMSHELRTPLNSIMILSKVLSENDGKRLTPKQVEYATLINRSGDELLGMINEVLDLAKIESGKQTVEAAPLALRDVEDYIRRMFTPIAAQKRLELAIDYGADLPATVRTDRTRLLQIVKNLLSNAFKFTERGAVRVRIYRPDAHPSIAEPFAISVTDTGIGIPADKLAQIFEAFTQADAGTSRKYGGTGLGLAIGRQLAGLLGGELTATSTPGEGSTFTLVLPGAGPAGAHVTEASPAIAPPAPARVEATKDPTLAGKTVLIVDDDMRNLYSLSGVLQDRGLVVVTAFDGNDALDAIARTPHVDAVVLDIMMPSMDGHETLARIKQSRAGEVPVIALTAARTPEEQARWLAAGGRDYLAKPLDIDELLAALRSALTATARDPEP